MRTYGASLVVIIIIIIIINLAAMWFSRCDEYFERVQPTALSNIDARYV